MLGAMSDLCGDCLELAGRTWPVRGHVLQPHLVRIFNDERDDLCEQSVHACRACRKLWLEVDNSYGPSEAEIGFSWELLEFEEFLRAHDLPDDYPTSAEEFWPWLVASGREVRVGLFSSGWAGPAFE